MIMNNNKKKTNKNELRWDENNKTRKQNEQNTVGVLPDLFFLQKRSITLSHCVTEWEE